ncbi:MAG: hypothetical protein AAFR76_13740 [Planctomycetota bacterium]
MSVRNSIIVLASAPLLLAPAGAALADTLVIDVSGRITSDDLDMPEQFADLNETFDAMRTNGEFTLTIYVPNFEEYSTGTHTVSLNLGNSLNYGPTKDEPAKIVTPGLSVLFHSTLLGTLEGVPTRVANKGWTFLPDETQLADVGEITITDGQVTSIKFGWIGADNPGLKSINGYIADRRGFPVKVSSIEIEADTFSTATKIGDLVLTRALSPAAAVDVEAADAGTATGEN